MLVYYLLRKMEWRCWDNFFKSEKLLKREKSALFDTKKKSFYSVQGKNFLISPNYIEA